MIDVGICSTVNANDATIIHRRSQHSDHQVVSTTGMAVRKGTKDRFLDRATDAVSAMRQH